MKKTIMDQLKQLVIQFWQDLPYSIGSIVVLVVGWLVLLLYLPIILVARALRGILVSVQSMVYKVNEVYGIEVSDFFS